VERGTKKHLIAVCVKCGHQSPLFTGWLSRLTWKALLERLVTVDEHECNR
jgi:hypothetical protein